MILQQTLIEPVNGYWDGGSKQVFKWSVDPLGGGEDSRGTFVRIGGWEANYWFCVARGKTEKQTLSYAKRHLQAITKIPSDFKYID